jgi:hypothetical protein
MPKQMTFASLAHATKKKVTRRGFVAQIGLRSDFPLPLTDLSYGNSFGYAKCCESV